MNVAYEKTNLIPFPILVVARLVFRNGYGKTARLQLFLPEDTLRAIRKFEPTHQSFMRQGTNPVPYALKLFVPNEAFEHLTVTQRHENHWLNLSVRYFEKWYEQDS